MKVSIIILTYKNQLALKNTIQSLSQQNFSFNQFEVIIVDNCSSGSAIPIFQNLKVDYPFLNLILLTNSKNNLGRARELGVNKANSKFIAFLDSDCLAPSEWLSLLVSQFEHQSENNINLCGIAGPQVYPSNTSIFFDALNIVLSSPLGHLYSPQRLSQRQNVKAEHLPTSNSIFLKKDIISIGNFSNIYADVCEDVDMCLRIRESSAKHFLLIESPIVFHYSSDNLKLWSRRMFLFGKGRSQIFFDHAKNINLNYFLPFMFLTIIVLLIFMIPTRPLLFLYFFGFYLFSCTILSLLMSINHNQPRCSFLIFQIIISTHLFYSYGLFYGLLKTIFNFLFITEKFHETTH